MTSEAPPLVSVILPTYNERENVSALVPRVLDALYGVDCEVIVVDDGSPDGTGPWLRERAARRGGGLPKLRVFHQENRGPAVARNRGVMAARGSFVAFLGDDTVPAPGWLAAHRNAQESRLARSIRRSGGCVGVIGRTDWHQRMRRTPFLDYINEHGLQFGFALIENEDDVPFNFFYTSNLSIDREAMAAEPFDPAFPFAAWEDVEAGYRLVGRGLRLLYRPQARVAHDHPTDLDRFAKRQSRAGYSAVVFYRRHQELGPFLGMQNDAPPEAVGIRGRAEHWLRERLARSLQRTPVRLPLIWEITRRHHYLEGMRKGWADGVGLEVGGHS